MALSCWFQGLVPLCWFACGLHPRPEHTSKRYYRECWGARRAARLSRVYRKPRYSFYLVCSQSLTLDLCGCLLLLWLYISDRCISLGKGDFAHVRELLYNGTDVVMAVFSLADSDSLEWLERLLKSEVCAALRKVTSSFRLGVQVIKRVDGAPLVLVGTKKDLRDSRLPRPVVGHSTPGSRGHLTPRQRQDFNCVSRVDGEERAARLGASHYFEVDGFDNSTHQEILNAVTLCGLEHRRPK